MKVHKVTVLIIDHDEIGEDEIKIVIENTRYPNRCIAPQVHSIESVEIGEWEDDNLLNIIDEADAEWLRLFPSLASLAEYRKVE